MNELPKKFSVLFVCTGNICRSPTAEGVFRHLVEQDGLSESVVTDSVGTHGYHVGEPPDRRSVDLAKERGVDLSSLRARKLHADDYDKFDLLLAMDSGHLGIMKANQPQGSRGALSLFLDYAPSSGMKDVPDPYYGGHDDFVHVYDLVEEGSRGILEYIKSEISGFR